MHWGNIDFKQLCSLCKGLLDTIANSDYWRSLHCAYELKQAERRKKNDGLSGKTDYFSG